LGLSKGEGEKREREETGALAGRNGEGREIG
jgi:hypothetical protein